MEQGTDDLIGTGEAAGLLGVSTETLRRWASESKIAHVVMPSGRLRFRRSDIAAVLAPVEPKGAA